jgi:hypothetical protein
MFPFQSDNNSGFFNLRVLLKNIVISSLRGRLPEAIKNADGQWIASGCRLHNDEFRFLDCFLPRNDVNSSCLIK